MKSTFRILGLVLALLAVAGVGAAAFVAVRGIPSYAAPVPAVAPIVATPARLAQGEKLVLASCVDCHLNRETGALSGHRLLDVPTNFEAIYSANITADKTHGIGACVRSPK